MIYIQHNSYNLGSEYIVERDFRRLYRPKDQDSSSVLKQSFFFLYVMTELNQGISTMWLLTQDLKRGTTSIGMQNRWKNYIRASILDKEPEATDGSGMCI